MASEEIIREVYKVLEERRDNPIDSYTSKIMQDSDKKAEDMKKQIIQYSKSFNGTYSDIELIKKLDIPRATYYKYKKEIKDKKQTTK